MKQWILQIKPESSQYKNFISTSRFEKYSLDLNNSAIRLRDFLASKDELCHEVEKLSVFVEEHSLKTTVTLFENEHFEHNFICVGKKIFINHFFVNTLTQLSEFELKSFALFFSILETHSLPELQIYLHDKLPFFLEGRKELLEESEYSLLYELREEVGRSKLNSLPEKGESLGEQGEGREQKKEKIKIPSNPTYLMALLMVSLLHYPNQKKLTLIEKKNLKEMFFSTKIKEALDLDSSDYLYLKKSADIKELSIEETKKLTSFSKAVKENKIQIVDYIEKCVAHKKVLFWCLWTISPLLTQDISRMISLIHQYKTIKRVHVDLPKSINPIFKKKSFDEDQLETKIKEIYPPIVSDYAKETLPYLKLLEHCHYFNIDVNGMGFQGNELSKNPPTLYKNLLKFDLDLNWKHFVNSEIAEIDSLQSDELVIFFYFLKPIYYLSPAILEHPEIESLIHTDCFTGYGPKKCENALSLYSRYTKAQQNSFVLPDLKFNALQNNSIVHFGFPRHEFVKVDESNFNRFPLFDSLLYSTKKGDGGTNFHYTPEKPKKKVIH